ncbi:MAG: tRNA pseudouridine(55) synthase TruB [Chlorobi bacterium]|nr:tRNA pseudouridine(55) synthase TruB [Chlorobiota bacterium]
MRFDFVNGEMLLIDKPLEWTSFDVVNHLRGFLRKVYDLKKLKVGHAGTLDPLATGLLIICTGKFTKKIDEYQGMDKSYVGSMHFGATTPSYDKETGIDREFDVSDISEEDILGAAKGFVGEIDQIPPIYSAVKVDGKRAFDYARNNKELKLKPRKVTISNFDIINIDLPSINFAIDCSKGTYIRSLARDFGEVLGKGAFLTELRRTRIGELKVSDAYSLEGFKKAVLDRLA